MTDDVGTGQTPQATQTTQATVDFYDATADWLATTKISAIDRRRARLADELPRGPHRVLELGAGFGGTAAATADLGHDVTAVERSPRRAAVARRHLLQERPGRLRIVSADFLRVELDGPYSVVACWSGFGSGQLDEHAVLLRRIAGWLAADGVGLVDVFDPDWWQRADGDERDLAGVRRRFGFDHVAQSFEIRYWFPRFSPFLGDASVHERVRCYDADEFADLCRTAGLRVLSTQVRGGEGGAAGGELQPSRLFRVVAA